MRNLLFVFMCFLLVNCTKTVSFMPENTLAEEDCVECMSLNGMTEELFHKIIDAGKQAYDEDAKNKGEGLKINAKWDDSTVNADCCRGCESGVVVVNMYGGLARREEITPEGFALVLGHELSHAYGGEPYVNAKYEMSAEGQSDYEGAKTAFKRIAALVPELAVSQEVTDFIKEKCVENVVCENTLLGGLSLGKLLSRLSGNAIPTYETPDTTVVSKTETSYPKTTQCRVDTYRAGALGEARPSCWYKAGTNPIPNPEPTPKDDECNWCWDCWTFHCGDYDWPWLL